MVNTTTETKELLENQNMSVYDINPIREIENALRITTERLLAANFLIDKLHYALVTNIENGLDAPVNRRIVDELVAYKASEFTQPRSPIVTLEDMRSIVQTADKCKNE
jgi:hypothetical protein